MHRNAKCVLITFCAGLLLVIILFQLQGDDTDGTHNVLQPSVRRENTGRISNETFQKPQPNNRNDNPVSNRQKAFQAPRPNNNKARAPENKQQIFQQSQPNFSHNTTRADESRRETSRQSQPNLGSINAGQKAPEMFTGPPPESPSQAMPTQAHQLVPPLKNPVPPQEVLQNMSHKNIQALYHSYVNSPQVACSWVERMGLLTDGGWELCDDPLYRPLKGDCLVYSYGINFDFSYDDDMAKYGCEVHAFDPSMGSAPHLRGAPGQNVFFHPSGVGARTGVISRESRVVQWQLYTIADHRKLLHHTPDKRRLDIVKMDVEGQELESLMAALDDGSLADVRQLNFETHVGWSKNDPSKDEYLKFLALFRKVYEKGFRIYVTHRNYVWSSFESLLFKGKSRAHCHEVHTININLRNTVREDGAVVGDGATTDATRRQRHSEQLELLEQEKAWYRKFNASKAQLIKKGS
ncbi:hypothetical protein BsWGS_22311 [Bradybaena similaris]